MKKKIAILGAGPSGLTAAKYALEAGFEPLILEQNSGLGGVWNPETGYVWESMKTNLSKYTCAFSDFPWPEEAPMFPSSEDMFRYLDNYAKSFKIDGYLNFNSKVINLRRNEEGEGWVVSWSQDEKTYTELVPYVVVATGIFAQENRPNIKGLKEFNGEVMHSKEYKDGATLKNKKVLVVGGSLSGAEVASNIANYTEVTHVHREPFWILERYIPPNPEKSNVKLPMDLVFYNRNFYERPAPLPSEKYVGKNKYMEVLCKKQQSLEDLKIDKSNFIEPIKITISDTYISQVENNKIRSKRGEIVKFEGSNAVFSDMSQESYDVVVLATGFKVNLDYLDADIQEILQYNRDDQIQPIILYKEAVHPELPGLFFVGVYKGPYFAVMEYQAKWASKVFSSQIILPSIEEMEKGIQEELNIRDMVPRIQFPHADYVKFADEIAKLSGENLDLQALKAKDNSLYNEFLKMTVIPGIGHFSIENAQGQIEEMKDIIGDALTDC